MLVILGILLFLTARNDKPLCKDCNIILVSLETLGSNHLPCYGYDRNTAPNLCKFADENVLFTNSYSNSSWTLPSWFSAITSLYPKHHSMLSVDDYLATNVKTLPEILEQNGYKTFYIGPKVDVLPLDKGFERGFQNVIEDGAKNITNWKYGYEVLRKNSNDKKIFLYLYVDMNHVPYNVDDLSGGRKRLYTKEAYPDIPLTLDSVWGDFSDEFKDYVSNQNDQFSASFIEDVNNANTQEFRKLFTPLPQQKRALIRYLYYLDKLEKIGDNGKYAKDLYDETIFYLDKQITNLFELVNSNKIKRDTIVIITSGHGEEFMEHRSLGHPLDHLYNTVTSVPLIMYIPGVKQKKVTDLVEGVDIMPTILSLVGIQNDSKVDGIDLTGLILGKNNAKRNKFIVSEGLGIDSIRDKDWKLYINYGSNNKKSLFDLNNDPGEQNNVAGENPSIVGKLHSALEKIIYGK